MLALLQGSAILLVELFPSLQKAQKCFQQHKMMGFFLSVGLMILVMCDYHRQAALQINLSFSGIWYRCRHGSGGHGSTQNGLQADDLAGIQAPQISDSNSMVQSHAYTSCGTYFQHPAYESFGRDVISVV